MKKILSAILTLALIVISLSACDLFSTRYSEGNATLVIATEEEQVYDIPLSELGEGNGLMPVFEYLKTEKGLEYELDGSMIKSIGGLENNYEMGMYIYIFTSLEKDFDVSEYKMEIEYGEKTLVSSGVGFSDMSLSDGTVIYIGLVKF